MQKTKMNIFFKLSKMILAVFLFIPFSVMAMDSASYQIDSDVINYYAGDSSSASYDLNAVGGETAIGDSSSSSYATESGFEYLDSGPYSISLSCDDNVSMGNIVGTGRSDLSTNDASCNIETDNPSGYKLYWLASAASMTNGSENIDAYTPAVSGTPEIWSVDSTAGEWGARLKKSGTTTYDAVKWGVANNGDSYASTDAKWLDVSNVADYEIVERTSATGTGGDDEVIQFGAEVGSNKFQTAGSYGVNIVITAVAL